MLTRLATWSESYTKLLAMNQTQYDRVLSLDSDTTVLQCLDELFLLPPSPVAMPRAYWKWDKEHELTSLLVLFETSATAFASLMHAIENADAETYDMEILNDLYFGSATVLPHRQYGLLTGEFNHGPKNHSLFTGSVDEIWDPEKALREAKIVHFSDWPVPKVCERIEAITTTPHIFSAFYVEFVWYLVHVFLCSPLVLLH